MSEANHNNITSPTRGERRVKRCDLPQGDAPPCQGASSRDTHVRPEVVVPNGCMTEWRSLQIEAGRFTDIFQGALAILGSLRSQMARVYNEGNSADDSEVILWESQLQFVHECGQEMLDDLFHAKVDLDRAIERDATAGRL